MNSTLALRSKPYDFNYFVIKFELLPGADRGFPIGGAPTLQGAPTYDFTKFCEKLHEIEKILGRRGAPPWIRHWWGFSLGWAHRSRKPPLDHPCTSHLQVTWNDTPNRVRDRSSFVIALTSKWIQLSFLWEKCSIYCYCICRIFPHILVQSWKKCTFISMSQVQRDTVNRLRLRKSEFKLVAHLHHYY